MCLASALSGALLVGLGPILIYWVAYWTAGEGGAADAQSLEQSLEFWRSRFLWIMPLGMGLVFFGVIGLLYDWVTRLAEGAAK